MWANVRLQLQLSLTMINKPMIDESAIEESAIDESTIEKPAIGELEVDHIPTETVTRTETIDTTPIIAIQTEAVVKTIGKNKTTNTMANRIGDTKTDIITAADGITDTTAIIIRMEQEADTDTGDNWIDNWWFERAWMHKLRLDRALATEM